MQLSFLTRLGTGLFLTVLLGVGSERSFAGTPTDQVPGKADTAELENRGIVLDDFFDDIDTIPDLPQETREGSPVTPERVPICHKGITIYVSRAAVALHTSHGDDLGPCPPDKTTYTIVCFKDKAMVVPLNDAVGYLRKGGSLGACNGGEAVIMCKGTDNIAVAQADVATYTKQGYKIGPCAGNEALIMCVKGRTIAVRKEYVDAYVKDGATKSPCPKTD